eukprot:3291477-Rhodomonas_salina.1
MHHVSGGHGIAGALAGTWELGEGPQRVSSQRLGVVAPVDELQLAPPPPSSVPHIAVHDAVGHLQGRCPCRTPTLSSRRGSCCRTHCRSALRLEAFRQTCAPSLSTPCVPTPALPVPGSHTLTNSPL